MVERLYQLQETESQQITGQRKQSLKESQYPRYTNHLASRKLLDNCTTGDRYRQAIHR